MGVFEEICTKLAEFKMKNKIDPNIIVLGVKESLLLQQLNRGEKDIVDIDNKGNFLIKISKVIENRSEDKNFLEVIDIGNGLNEGYIDSKVRVGFSSAMSCLEVGFVE